MRGRARNENTRRELFRLVEVMKFISSFITSGVCGGRRALHKFLHNFAVLAGFGFPVGQKARSCAANVGGMAWVTVRTRCEVTVPFSLRQMLWRRCSTSTSWIVEHAWLRWTWSEAHLRVAGKSSTSTHKFFSQSSHGTGLAAITVGGNGGQCPASSPPSADTTEQGAFGTVASVF
jgi:hypothetical protein